MKFLLITCCWPCLLLVLANSTADDDQVVPERRQSLADSIRFLDVTRGVLRKVGQVGWLSKLPYREWILQKLDTVHLYVSAGQTLAEKLDPDLLEALAGLAAGNGRSEARMSSFDDYVISWRRKPAEIPAYVRKSKTKLSDDEEELDEDYSASQDRGYYKSGGSYGGGGKGGYGGGRCD